MEYRPFIVRLAGGPSGVEARVIDSPMGSGAAAPFENPLTPGDLALLASLFEAAAREPPPAPRDRHLEPARTESPAERQLEEAGRRLYRALLRGPVGELWNRNLGSLSGRPGAGLRLEVRIDPESEPLRELQGLPWELLHAPGRTEGFLCRRRRTTVVRHLELPRPRETPQPPSPLRVLLVAPSPAGVAPLDLAGEARELESALARRPDVRLRRLEAATLDALVAAFEAEPVHVLHFMGHGIFEAGSGRGSLVFEAGGRTAAPVAAERLAGQLADFVPPLRLVFLNACRTAEAASRAPYAGVATALVEAGVPAVVAMQYPVSDAAAVVFSAEVYRRLAAAEPVDRAVAAGRKAIERSRPAGSPEWATPALFLRVPDGRLFAPRAAERPREDGSRARLAAAVAGGLGLAAVAGLLLWGGAGDSGGRAEEQEPGKADVTAADEVEEPDAAAVEGVEEPPPVEAGLLDRRSAGNVGDEAEVEKNAPALEPAPASRTGRGGSGFPELPLGETVYVTELQAHVTAELVLNLGREMVKVTVSLDEHDPQVLSGFPGNTLSFRFGGESLSVHLVSLDRDSGTVRLRVGRSAGRADRSW